MDLSTSPFLRAWIWLNALVILAMLAWYAWWRGDPGDSVAALGAIFIGLMVFGIWSVLFGLVLLVLTTWPRRGGSFHQQVVAAVKAAWTECHPLPDVSMEDSSHDEPRPL